MVSFVISALEEYDRIYLHTIDTYIYYSTSKGGSITQVENGILPPSERLQIPVK